jgi:hypothetical protein
VWEGAQGFFGKELHQMICSSCIIKLSVLNGVGWGMDNYILFWGRVNFLIKETFVHSSFKATPSNVANRAAKFYSDLSLWQNLVFFTQ